MVAQAAVRTILLIALPLLATAYTRPGCPAKNCLDALKSVNITASNCSGESFKAELCIGRLEYKDVCYCGFEYEEKYLRYNDNPGLLKEEICEQGNTCRFSELVKCYMKAKRAFKLRGNATEAIACMQAWSGNPNQCFWKKAKYILYKPELTPSLPWKQLAIQALGAIQDGCNHTIASQLIEDDYCNHFGGLMLHEDFWGVQDGVESGLLCMRRFLDANPVCERARPLVEASFAVLTAAADRKYKSDDNQEYLWEACEYVWDDYEY